MITTLNTEPHTLGLSNGNGASINNFSRESLNIIFAIEHRLVRLPYPKLLFVAVQLEKVNE